MDTPESDGEPVKIRARDRLAEVVAARGGQPRPQQIAFVDAAEAALAHAGDYAAGVSAAVLKASTGVGKSFGYLVPAILSAVKGRMAVVVTESIALQEQLVEKDLPFLAEALGLPNLRYGLQKGKANYACFPGDTRLLTYDGAVAFKEVAGTTQTVVDGNGKWVEAEIEAFGAQRLHRITLTRNGRSKAVHATAEHRWFVQNVQAKPAETRTTVGLRPGDKLTSQFPHRSFVTTSRFRPSPFGVAHGVVFGDGTVFHNERDSAARLALHGESVELLRYFPLCRKREWHQDGYASPQVDVWDIPAHFKARCDLNVSKNYLYGFLAGWFAADGCVDKNGAAVLCNKDRAVLEWARDAFTRLGVITYPISERSRGRTELSGRNYTGSTLFHLGINAATAGAEFFVRSKHQDRLAGTFENSRVVRRALRWKVVDVEETDRVEEVFCAVVPTTHSFVLEDFILTGNCLSRLDEIRTESGQLSFDPVEHNGLDPAVREEVGRIAAWSDHSPTGDKGDLDFEPSSRAWQMVTVSHDSCAGDKCPRYGDCFAERARLRNKGVHVLVVNAHLYAINAIHDGKVLPEHDVVVIDEAHTFPGVVASMNSVSFSSRTITAVARAFGRLVDDDTLVNDLMKAAYKLDEVLAGIGPDKRLVDQQRQVVPAGAVRFPGELVTAFDETAQVLGRAMRALAKVPDDDPKVVSRKARLMRQMEKAAAKLAVTGLERPGVWCWVDGDDRGFSLELIDVDVAPTLSGYWEGDADKHLAPKSVVACSATLPTGFVEAMGLPPATVFEDVGTPFDFKLPGMGVYVPAHLPSPKDQGWQAAVVEELHWTWQQSTGGMLALFTADRSRKAAEDALKGKVPHLLVQGQLPKKALVARFKELQDAGKHPLLLALKSFFTGVDLPGMGAVFIDKIPYPVPTDPVIAARCELAEAQGRNPFTLVSVNDAAMDLTQAAGRLIRQHSDRGVVVIGDKRLLQTTESVRRIWRMMPPFERVTSRPAAQRVLQGGAATADVGAESTLFEQDGMLFVAPPPAPAQPAPARPTGRQPARAPQPRRSRPANQYPGPCGHCGRQVPANAGEREKVAGKWAVFHRPGDPNCAAAKSA